MTRLASRFERFTRPAARPVLRAAGLALAVAALWAAQASVSPARAAGCQPASYCAGGGRCLTIRQVRREVMAAFSPGNARKWRISRVRLVGHAPTPTCLWYEVRLVGPTGKGRVVYWNVTGGRAR